MGHRASADIQHVCIFGFRIGIARARRWGGHLDRTPALLQPAAVARLQPSLVGAADLLKLKLVSAASVRDRRFSFSKI